MSSRGAHQRVDVVVAHEGERGDGQGGDDAQGLVEPARPVEARVGRQRHAVQAQPALEPRLHNSNMIIVLWEYDCNCNQL